MAKTAWLMTGSLSLLWEEARNQKYFYHLNLFISVLDGEICIGCNCNHIIEGLNESAMLMYFVVMMGRTCLLWGEAQNQKYFYHSKLFISALKSKICMGTFAITILRGPIEI